jgi:glycoside/pentoside/hexuronide:cation symporter, GPH family
MKRGFGMEDKGEVLSNKIPQKQKLYYALYFLGQGISYSLVYLYLETYGLDIGISAFAIFVILLLIKCVDAIDDTLFGFIIEKVHLKGGKYYPWLKISVMGIPITTILLFAIPGGLPLWVIILWFVVAYFLWDFSYTVGDVPLYALSTTMTDSPQERTNIVSLGRVVGMLTIAVCTVGVPLLEDALNSWFLPALIFMGAFALSMVPICFKKFDYERFQPKREKDPSFKAMFHYVIGNKYMLIFYIALNVWYVGNLVNTLSIIFARYCLGGDSQASMVSVAAMLPWVLCAVVVPFISRHIDKALFFKINVAASILIGLVEYFVGYDNYWAMMVLLFLHNIPVGFISTLLYTFCADMCEYQTYRMGVDAKGVGFAAHTFFTKLMGALQTALSSLCLGIIGYVSGTDSDIVQPADLPKNIWVLVSLVPVFTSALSLPLFLFYNLRDKDITLMTECNTGKITKAECESKLSRKYWKGEGLSS